MIVAELDYPDSRLDKFDELSPSLIDGFSASIFGLISSNDGYFYSTSRGSINYLNYESFF